MKTARPNRGRLQFNVGHDDDIDAAIPIVICIAILISALQLYEQRFERISPILLPAFRLPADAVDDVAVSAVEPPSAASRCASHA
jgi:hypothetical protein